jgi:hypothetical protein
VTSIPASYLEGPRFDFSLDILSSFPQPLQASDGIVPSDIPQLPPFISFLIYHSQSSCCLIYIINTTEEVIKSVEEVHMFPIWNITMGTARTFSKGGSQKI